MALRFHWMLPQAGEPTAETPQASARYRVEQTRVGSPAARTDVPGWLRFAHAAEGAGIESVLISLSRHEPDPVLVSCALGGVTKRLGFIIAHRAGLAQPSAFVQQFNTLSDLIDGRVALNIVAGSSTAEQHAYGDFLGHEERWARAEEYLTVCHGLWRSDEKLDFDGEHYRVAGGQFPTRFRAPGRSTPEVYVSGHSERAEALARTRGSCWLRIADTPRALQSLVARSRESGTEVCLRACVMCRPTREEAVQTALSLVPHCQDGLRDRSNADVRDDSAIYREAAALADETSWLDERLWLGLSRLCGPVWTTLLGTPEELARAFLEYGRIGVTQFILSGWPETAEVTRFGREVLPLVRQGECA